MFAFLAPGKFQSAVTVLVFIATTIAEVLTVKLYRAPIDIVQNMTKQDQARTASAGVWAWLNAASGPGAELRHALFALFVAKAFYWILVWARSVTGNWQSMSMVYYMRAAVYDRLQRVGFSFHDQYSTGQLINRALSDLQSVRNFVITGLHSSTDIIFSLIGYFIMMLHDFPPVIAWTALIPLPFWFWAVRRMALLSQHIYEKQVKAGDDMVQKLTENVAGVHVVRAFATEAQEHKKFEQTATVLLKRVLDGVRVRVWMSPVIRGIAASAHIGLFLLGAILVQRGSMHVGGLVVLGAAMGAILGKIQQINAIADAYQQAVVSSDRLFEILDSPDGTPQRKDAEPLRPGGGAVHFSRVSFGYEPGQPVLQDISFSAPAGAVIALVGPTGSGKTTLANLLGRFYDPDLGRIEVDGEDLRDVTVKSVHEAVGYVFQETYLFSDSISRNIAYGDSDAPKEKIAEAARIAKADEFIERLPKKYENMIGEYGATLSGGQRQRLAIARAILHNPRILVMDDSLSAVDPETEEQIRQGLDRIMKGRTVFLITSRISSARRADKILVVENGRVTQSGTHDELMATPGYYSEVADSQFAEAGSRQEASHMDRMTQRGISRRLASEV